MCTVFAFLTPQLLDNSAPMDSQTIKFPGYRIPRLEDSRIRFTNHPKTNSLNI